MAIKWNGSRIRQILISAKSDKRIVPSSFGVNYKNDDEKTRGISQLVTSKGNNIHSTIKHKNVKSAHIRPAVYYNGCVETLDELPHDKLKWIYQTSPAENHLTQLASPHSVFLHNPQMKRQPKDLSNPMAMVYWRVLDVVNLSFAKKSAYYCTVQVGDQMLTGNTAVSDKYGKHYAQAKIDEMYLFDLDQASTMTFRLHKKIKHSIFKGGKNGATDICLGQKKYHAKLRPSEKQAEKVIFQYGQDTYQVMVMRGTFMSNRAQSLLANQVLYADFITVYLRGSIIPRWQRYWGVLQATKLALYDFEYKETKAAQVILPLDGLEKVFHPSHIEDDDEQMVDVGRLGLALQFTYSQLSSYGGGNRMFILPDDNHSCQGWEESFNFSASLVEEFKMALDDKKSSVPRITNNGSIMIPDKFLW
ncbi:unnamed protein product [Absidia cylindrospora]